MDKETVWPEGDPVHLSRSATPTPRPGVGKQNELFFSSKASTVHMSSGRGKCKRPESVVTRPHLPPKKMLRGGPRPRLISWLGGRIDPPRRLCTKGHSDAKAMEAPMLLCKRLGHTRRMLKWMVWQGACWRPCQPVVDEYCFCDHIVFRFFYLSWLGGFRQFLDVFSK
jgi:hypothetical protein